MLLGRLKLKQHAGSDTKGFTLIELVVVVVLLGILVALALPKFADLTTFARTASAEGIAAAFTDGINLAHSEWSVQGMTGAGTITLEGSTVTLNAQGWPEGAGANNTAKCIDVWNSLVNNPPSISATQGAADYRAIGSATQCTYEDNGGNPANNTITYTKATGGVAFS